MENVQERPEHTKVDRDNQNFQVDNNRLCQGDLIVGIFKIYIYLDIYILIYIQYVNKARRLLSPLGSTSD